MAAALIAVVSPAVADATPVVNQNDHMAAVSSLCTKHFARLERQYGIPKHLLMAIGGTESGRWNKELGMAVPWPWTINAEGKGQYFKTMHEAVTAVRRLQAKGVKSIDIGCMQVNLKHHPDAFASVTQAFDPAHNTRYAAQFLRQNYDVANQSWSKAIAAYHSKTTRRGQKYYGRVKHNWKRVLASVRGERMGELPYVSRGGEGMQLAELTVDGTSSSRLLRSKKDTSIKKYRSPSMKIIKVTQKPVSSAKRDEVLVIRPTSEKKPATVELARNQARNYTDDAFIIGSGVKKPLVTAPGSADTQGRVSSRKKGPNFIFN